MKILFVTMQFGRSYAQGTERYVATLGQCLRQRGHEVSVLAGVPDHLGPAMPLGETVDPERQILAYPTRGWMAVVGLSPRRLAAWLARHRPDVVHLNTPAHIGVGAIVACRRLGIPCVVTVHDYWWVCPKGILLGPEGGVCDGTVCWPTCVRCIAGDHRRPWVRRLSHLPRLLSPFTLTLYFARAATRGTSPADMLRWLQRRAVLIRCLDAADRVIFPSKAIAQVMASWLSHRRWQVIPNGLAQGWFKDPKPPPTQPQKPEELTIGFAGALAPHKAPHLLLEAVRHLGWSATRIRLASPASDAGYLQRLQQAAAGLNVEFAGCLPPDQMPAFFRSLDVLAMTSICPENCPYVVLEAQAAGVPVVGGNLAGLAELIGDEKMLFEPGSAEALAQALDHVRRHPQAAKPAKVQTADEMTDATEAVYRKIGANSS